MTVVIGRRPAWSVRAIRNGSRRASDRTSCVERQPAGHDASTHGSASTRSRDRRPQPVGPEPDRVVGRQAGLGRDGLDDPAGLGVVRDRARC